METKLKILRGATGRHKIWQVFDGSGSLIDFWDRDEREEIPPNEKKMGLTKAELIEVLKEKGLFLHTKN